MLISVAYFIVLLLGQFNIVAVHALPSWSDSGSAKPQDAVLRRNIASKRLLSRSVAGGVALRIDPLGDSITYGSDSTDGNGYRKDLQTLIVQGGNSVQFIGSVSSGTMTNNNNEGHPGYTIDQIGGQAHNSLPELPNVVLLMGGTNDIVQVLNLATAPERLGSLIDLVFSFTPYATVIVASLTPLLDPTREAAVVAFNQAIPAVIASRANAGQHILLANMSAVTAADITVSDGIHPNDYGYSLMAQAWYAAITDAGNRGWIQAPEAGAAIPPETNGTNANGSWESCPVFPAWPAPVEIAYGTGSGPNPGDGVRFADINGDGLSDYLWLGTDGSIEEYLNEGPAAWPQWNNVGTSTPIAGVNRSDVIFADVTCDGWQDLLVVNDIGGVTAYYNNHNFPNCWGPASQYIAYGVGGTASQVRFADIDGDGCADYLEVLDNGAVNAWLNTGANNFPNWNGPVTVAPGFGAPGSEVQFADLNGDGLSDYLVISPTDGSVQAWINNGPGSGYTWNSLGAIALGVGVTGNYVAFADVDGDRQADYLKIDASPIGDIKFIELFKHIEVLQHVKFFQHVEVLQHIELFHHNELFHHIEFFHYHEVLHHIELFHHIEVLHHIQLLKQIELFQHIEVLQYNELLKHIKVVI